MTPARIIAKKRDGQILTPEEIAFFVGGFHAGQIPDYQMSALAMAIYLQGMNSDEVAVLTDEMLNSGSRLDWSGSDRPKVDKHSTGGIGDKVSLILAPLLACCGLDVPMLSGRGLGPTGGTLDKLESIPGFRCDLSLDEIQRVTTEVGCVITGASNELAPADRRLYALRDVTATVESIPLITGSIMSKKLAESLDALVLDVKFGSGAFMQSRDQACALAHSLVATGKRMNVATTALLTDMNQPLGRMAGNANEVNESIACLRGEGPDDLNEVTLALCTELLLTTSVTTDETSARRQLTEHLTSGRAMERFERMVHAQGGDLSAKRCIAPATDVTSERHGIVAAIDTRALGFAIIELGGGRKKASDLIDHSVGLEMLVRIGDKVPAGQPLARVFTREPQTVLQSIRDAVRLSDKPIPATVVIADRITEADV